MFDGMFTQKVVGPQPGEAFQVTEFLSPAELADVQAGTALVNVTTSLKAFYDYLIANRIRGRLIPGTYLITRGVLLFDNAFVSTPWPDVETSGHLLTIFKVDGATNVDAPMMEISNGDANSTFGAYWTNGSHGGITFLDQTGQTGTNKCGLSIRGMYGTKFGWIKGETLPGDVLKMPEKLYNTGTGAPTGGTNPDPYGIVFCHFDAVENRICTGYAINNQNYVGFNCCSVDLVRGSVCGGGIIGPGASVKYGFFSFISVSGWIVDERETNTGGNSSRCIFEGGELDNVKYGFRINFGTLFHMPEFRFVHRYHFANNTGRALTVGNNPITSGTIGTPTFKLTSVAHGVVAGQHIAITGSAAVDGIPAAEINVVQVVTSVPDADTMLFTVTTPATAGGVVGGGASVTATERSYWPRKAVEFLSTPSGNVLNGDMQLTHRFEAGGTIADLGVICNGNNLANITGVNIDHHIADSVGLGVLDSHLFTGINNTTTMVITRDGRRINDTQIKVAAIVKGSTGTSLGTIANNAITSGTIATKRFRLTTPSPHGLVVNQIVGIQGATTVDGIAAAEINRSHPVTSVIDATTLEFTSDSNATAGGVAGGGAAIAARKDQTIINITGFGTEKNKLAFPTKVLDRGVAWSATLYEYTVAVEGYYNVTASIFVALAAGSQVRFSVYKNIHTAGAILKNAEYRCQGTNREMVQLSGCIGPLVVGDKVSLNASQNTAVAVLPNVVSDHDTQFSIALLP